MSSSQSLTQQPKPVLEATAHDIRHIAAVLRGVNFGSSQRATVNILAAGMTILVEEARSLLGQAFLPFSVFETYSFTPPKPSRRGYSQAKAENPDAVCFEIDLTALITCLDMFGTAGGSSFSGGGGSGRANRGKGGNRDREDGTDWGNQDDQGRGIEKYFSADNGKVTGMRMNYIGEGHPLTIILSEDASGPVTSCHITTLEAEAHLDLPFDDDEKLVRVIMKSSWLSEALSELDACDKLTIMMSPPTVPLPASTNEMNTQSFSKRDAVSRARFRLLGTGSFGSTEMDYPNDRDVLETFECEEPTKFSYKLHHVSRASRALQGSLKTSLRINEEGVLNLQFMMPSAKVRGKETANAFIEFKCLALEDNDDDE